MLLTTERLRIRPFSLGDDSFILKLLNTPGWLANIGDRKVYTADDAQKYLLKGPLKSYHDFGFGLNCVELLTTREPIGMCGLIRREGLDKVDLGFAFLPEYHGQGFAFEAADEVLRYAFHSLKLSQVVAITLPSNLPCISVLKKLGMEQNGQVQLPAGKEKLDLFSTLERSDNRPPFFDFPLLENERIILREIQFEEVKEVEEILYYNQKKPSDSIEALRILHRVDRNYRQGTSINWGIIDKASGTLVGNIGYYRGFAEETGEVGFVMKEKFRRKGFIKEALSLAVPFGFEKMKLKRILALAREDNLPSRNLLSSCGFYETGHVSENHIEYQFQFSVL